MPTTIPIPSPPPRAPRTEPPALAAPAAGFAVSTVVAVTGEPVFEHLLDERVVVIGGEIDDAAAHRVTAQLLLLAARDARRDIALYVLSPGGPAAAGLAIYDTMRLVAPDVATWAVGVVASTAQLLVTAGAPGKRHALPHARLRLHQPTARLGAGTDPAVRAGVTGELRGEVAAAIARHSGRPVADVLADCDADRWFTAAQAREHGLVDHVPV